MVEGVYYDIVCFFVEGYLEEVCGVVEVVVWGDEFLVVLVMLFVGDDCWEGGE